MGYKKTIDSIREQQKRLRFNIAQVIRDIGTLPRDLTCLFEEHHAYTRKLIELDELIEATQPKWRKWFDCRY